MPIKKKIYSNLLEAQAVGYKALRALSDSRKKAKVHSIFDRAFYLQFGSNSLISVIKNKDYVSPTSILIRESEDRSCKSIGIKEGVRVKFDKHALIFGDNVLAIELGKSSTWFSPPLLKQNDLIDLISISLNLRVLRDVIYTCPSREGLVPLLENVELYGPLQLFLQSQEPTLSERARPDIEMLMWGLFGGDFSTVISKALQILGLGPGLTPSCDDFLTGLILSLTIGGRVLLRERKKQLEFYRRVAAEICRAARGKTTIYSESFLNQARRGEGPKAVIELIHSLLTKNASQVAAVSKTVINMGETSGADIAIGIYYGTRFLLSKLELSELERIEDLYGIA